MTGTVVRRASRRHWRIVFAVFACTLLGVARADDDALPATPVLTEQAAIEQAVSANPGLDEMRRRADAAAAVPDQAGSLPDPRITLGAANLPVDTFSLDQEAMTQLQLGVTQAFPYPGKRALQRDVAASRAAAAAQSADEARLQLVRNVRNTWWELFYLDRAQGTLRRNMGLLRQLVDVARTKYEVGRGLQQDVLLAQVELARLQDMLVRVDGARGVSAARLNALLARPADTPVRLPPATAARLPDVPPEASLERAADQSRAAIAAARHQLDAAQSAEALAHKEYLPEFGVSVNYGFRQGRNPNGTPRADFASVMLNFSVPLFARSKQDRLVDQRHAEAAAAARGLADTRNRVQADIAAALAGYRQARDEYQLLDTGILPQTGQAVASMLAGYQVNKVDFLTLVRTQITLYDHELQRWRALAQAHQAYANLLAAVGRETLDE